MKKFTAMALALAMVLTLLAGCGKTQPEETTPAYPAPGSALEILETVWGDYAQEEKFAIIGGNIEANIMDAPGSYDLTYAENMTWNLLVPADKIANVEEAASMIHMMNANTFTCGAFKINGITAADFGAAMEQAIQNNQWMCGFPETLVIANIAGEYVLVAFGINDAMNPFQTNFAAAYPEAQVLVNEPIA